MSKFLRWGPWLVLACLLATVAMAQPPAVEPGGPQARVQAEVIYTPDSSIKFALADLLTLPPKLQPFVRYLSLYNIPKERRRDLAKVISFLVNSLGTRRQVYIPLFVGGSDETVIRLNIDDYEWDPQSWERLAQNGSGVRPFPEPYFHAFVQKVEKPVGTRKVKKTVTETVPVTEKVPYTKVVKKFTGYYDQYKKPIYKDEEVVEYVEQTVQKEVTKEVEVDETTTATEVVKRVQVQAPWLDPAAIAQLVKLTGSQSPVIRADWFVYTASQPPAYHDFLRLGNNIADFEKLIFSDPVLAAQARSQDKAVHITSVVARNNRTLTRSPSFTGGYYWQSHDSLKSIDDRQYLQNFLNEEFDATEDIGSLPNGLQAYFLTDGAGNRVDFANPDVAIDYQGSDKIVRTGRSCIWCHGNGILPLQDEIRTLTKKLQNAEEVKLLVTNERDARKVLDLFGGDIDRQIVADQNYYADAVARVNGLGAQANAKLFQEWYDFYVEMLLTKDIVARDIGITTAELEKYLRLSVDNVVLGMIQQPHRPIRRDQWEVSYQGFQLVILGAQKNAVPIQPFVSPTPVFVPEGKKRLP